MVLMNQSFRDFGECLLNVPFPTSYPESKMKLSKTSPKRFLLFGWFKQQDLQIQNKVFHSRKVWGLLILEVLQIWCSCIIERVDKERISLSVLLPLLHHRHHDRSCFLMALCVPAALKPFASAASFLFESKGDLPGVLFFPELSHILKLAWHQCSFCMALMYCV